jgi:hypothetical protein
MKIVVTILYLFVYSLSLAQTSFLKEAVAKLDKALITKDTAILKQLLHKDLSYGHSNAWVETKTDVIKDLISGKLAYSKIESKDFLWTASKDWATVRTTSAINYLLDGKEGTLQLHVMQCWLKTNKGWQLIARQSTKL